MCVRMLAAPINPSDINRIEGSIAFLLIYVSDFSFPVRGCDFIYLIGNLE